MKRIVLLPTTYPRAAIGLLALLTAAAIFGLSQLGFDDAYKDVFRSPDVRFARLQLLDEAFGAGDDDCVLLLESADMLSRPSLDVVREMHGRLNKLPGVESVTSLFTARQQKRVGRVFLPLFPGRDATDDELEAAASGAEYHPLIHRRLLSRDRRAAMLIVRLDPEKTSIEQVESTLAEIRTIARECAAGTDVTSLLTGMPAIRVETVRRIQHEHVIITAAGTVLATLFAWLLLRRLAAVVLVVAPAMVGIVWTMGTIGLAGRNLDAINIVLPALVMVIGIADSIHIVFHFRDHCAEGATPREAMTAAMEELFGACAVTALTTASGFLSLLTADDRIIGQFGIFGGIGVLLTFLAVIVMLPLMATTRLGALAAPKPEARHVAPQWPTRFLDWLLPRRWWSAVTLIAATGLMIWISQSIEADYSFTENLTDASESFTAMRKAEEKFGGGPLLQVMVEWPADKKLQSPETLAILQEVHDAVAGTDMWIERDNNGRAPPLSILTVLETLPGPADDVAAKFKELEYVPADRLRALVREDRRLALVTANVPDIGAAALRRPLDGLERKLDEIERSHAGYRIMPTGFAIVSTYRTTPMIMDLFQGLSLEVVVIFAVISLLLRSPVIGVLSLPSNLFPLLATVATIVVLGWKLQYATVLALNICLGIAVDDTVHFLTEYRQELRRTGDRRQAVYRSFASVAPVMVTTTVLMLTGFGAGLFCTIPTIRAFSGGSCLALLFALASECLVLPTLLFCLADNFVVRPSTVEEPVHSAE